MSNMFEGKVAVVTGGAQGIGRAIAELFITGENICVDGGMARLMIYHGDHGWRCDGEGCDR